MENKLGFKHIENYIFMDILYLNPYKMQGLKIRTSNLSICHLRHLQEKLVACIYLNQLEDISVIVNEFIIRQLDSPDKIQIEFQQDKTIIRTKYGQVNIAKLRSSSINIDLQNVLCRAAH